ncbi:MAG: hyperosmotically inducible periplasmic protein [Acidobacteriota bacterium]|nr:hyperosmotically inducible periplasmic protein [Acidobacteriota bacterium]
MTNQSKMHGWLGSTMACLALLMAGVAPARAAESHSDTMITLGVHVALIEKLGADALQISVNTHAGHVQLAGTVAKRETKELAPAIAKGVSGVASIDNDLRTQKEVTGSDAVSVAAKEVEHESKDALLASKVRLALMNKMGTDAFKVHTHVANNVVTLAFTGDLAAAERAKAEQIAGGMESVKKVIVLAEK